MSSIAKYAFEGGGPGQYDGSLQFINTNTPILGLYYDSWIIISVKSLGPQLRVAQYSKVSQVEVIDTGNRSDVTWENNGFTIKPKGTAYLRFWRVAAGWGDDSRYGVKEKDKRGTVNIIICKILAPPGMDPHDPNTLY